MCLHEICSLKAACSLRKAQCWTHKALRLATEQFLCKQRFCLVYRKLLPSTSLPIVDLLCDHLTLNKQNISSQTKNNCCLFCRSSQCGRPWTCFHSMSVLLTFFTPAEHTNVCMRTVLSAVQHTVFIVKRACQLHLWWTERSQAKCKHKYRVFGLLAHS